MELTLDQALQKGIEAHKAGQVQEADRLYTAILKAQPKHADANHNMGVLAVGVGKVQEALPFFKTALEANPNTAQFWLSYIDALIKLEKLADAKAVLDQAKESGAKGDSFDKMEKTLEGVEPSETTASQNQDPPRDQLQPMINLYGQGQFQKTLDMISQLLQKFPNSVNLYNIQGAANAALGQLDAAIDSYKKALTIKPGYAEAYSNMGVALKDQGRLEEAIEAYNKTLAIKPDYAEAYYNMGIALKDQGRLEEAVGAYNKAIAIKPDYAEAYNNMGNALLDQGKLEEAIEAYAKAIAIDPSFTECFVNLNSLQIQLSKPNLTALSFNSGEHRALNNKPLQDPRCHILHAISNFLQGKFCLSVKSLKKCRALIRTNVFQELSQNDQVFCSAYLDLLSSLIKNITPTHYTRNPKIYHVGDSHCLSYGHSSLCIETTSYAIVPKITFGAKAFHFSNKSENLYKVITANHLKKIPSGSLVFVSNGEIDCRANEGIIQTSNKTAKPFNEIIDETVHGYVDWFLDLNIGNQHTYYFFNIPAPMYDQQYSKSVNDKVAKIVALFNVALSNKVSSSNTKIIDVYRHTVDKKGFSNGLYHCDNRHLDSRILPLIENVFDT